MVLSAPGLKSDWWTIPEQNSLNPLSNRQRRLSRYIFIFLPEFPLCMPPVSLLSFFRGGLAKKRVSCIGVLFLSLLSFFVWAASCTIHCYLAILIVCGVMTYIFSANSILGIRFHLPLVLVTHKHFGHVK
jgi:hypothetical protein